MNLSKTPLPLEIKGSIQLIEAYLRYITYIKAFFRKKKLSKIFISEMKFFLNILSLKKLVMHPVIF